MKKSAFPHSRFDKKVAIPVVRISNLGFSYKSRSALENLSLEVREGELFGILGPNGSGKSTLFRILSTLVLPGSGNAEIVGRSVVHQAAEVRRRIGVVFQSPSLDVKLTVLENLMAQGRFYGLMGATLAERIGIVLKELRIENRARDLVETLSGGLQRRVELAKGLLHAPQVLLLDEPTTGLDPRARADFWRFLNHLRKRQSLTTILTTHLTQEAEECDRIAILDHGKLVVEGSPAELKETVGGEVVSLVSSRPDALRKAIERRLKIRAQIVEGEIRLQLSHAARFIPRLARTFPDMIESVTVRKPSLEDVFLRQTGHTMEPAAPEAG